MEYSSASPILHPPCDIFDEVNKALVSGDMAFENRLCDTSVLHSRAQENMGDYYQFCGLITTFPSNVYSLRPASGGGLRGVAKDQNAIVKPNVYILHHQYSNAC